MLAALFFGYRRLWVFGWLYDDVVKQRDEWKSMAIHGLEAAAEVTQAAREHTIFSPQEAEVARRIVREADRTSSKAGQ
jgi:hypothetical protein